MDTLPRRPRTPLRGISSRAWEHPTDRGMLIALRQLRGFDFLVRKLSSGFSERMVRMQLVGSGVRVSERQFRHLHGLLVEVATSLDAPALPELFVRQSPFPNASCVGVDQPMIVVQSGLLDLLDADSLRFVLGHELGHALSGHALYRTLLELLLDLNGLVGAVPVAPWALFGLRHALGEWARKAELSGDRAGLLAVQDVNAAMTALMAMASGGHADQLDVTEFLEQGREYSEPSDLTDSVMKLLLSGSLTHPMTVQRASELRRWSESGQYTTILAGDYPRRADDADAKPSAAAREAAEQYAAQFRESEDAGAKLLRDLGSGVTEAGRRVGDRFRPNR